MCPSALSPAKQHNIEQIEDKLNHDNLKSAIRALNEKLKFYENIETDKNIVQDELEQSDVARQELRSNIKETAERIKDDKDKSNKYQQILINENESLSKQILMITDMFSKKVQEHDDTKQELSITQKDFNVVQVSADNLKDYYEKYSREAKTNEELNKMYFNVNEELETKAQEYQKKVEEILEEKT